MEGLIPTMQLEFMWDRCACGCGELPKPGSRYVRYHYIPVFRRPTKSLAELKHGSSAYKRGCRCDVCRAWRRDESRRYVPPPRDPNKPITRHGLTGHNQGCRCDVCRETVRAYLANYYRTHKERSLVTSTAWRRANPEKRKASVRKWGLAHPENSRANRRRYYARHREACRAAALRWHYAHRDQALARHRRDYREHLAARKAYSYQYARSARGRASSQRNRWRRRALNRAAAGEASQSQITGRIAMYGGLCYVCRASATEIDHVIPLTRGGTNWPANLRPICRACNIAKRNHPLSEFLLKRAALVRAGEL